MPVPRDRHAIMGPLDLGNVLRELVSSVAEWDYSHVTSIAKSMYNFERVRSHRPGATDMWLGYRVGGRPNTEPTLRQRELLFALGSKGSPIDALRRLTPGLAERYSGKDRKTVTHDVNKLVELGLAEKTDVGTLRPRIELIEAFIPGTSGRRA